MSHRTTFLGFNIDTRTMQVTWPLDKQTRLRDRINEIIQAATQDNGFVSCRLIAQALGLLRNGCAVLPLGATLSLQIQHAFNDCIKDHMRKGTSIRHQRVFWDSAKIRLTDRLRHDFKALRALLPLGDQFPTMWSRPIGLLIPRECTFTFFSDASHEGLGGWCPQLRLMWRITKGELQSLGFIMAVHSEPSPGDPIDILHINALEFLALSVNVWFALASCHVEDPSHTQHHIGNFFTDNTSALSWMLHAGRAKSKHSRQLARFLQALLTFSPVRFQFQSHHISGQSNETADLLSRPSRGESWGSVIRTRPHDLFVCKPYQVQRGLLSALRGCIVSDGTAAMSVAKTIALSTPVLRISPPGWEVLDTTIGLCD